LRRCRAAVMQCTCTPLAPRGCTAVYIDGLPKGVTEAEIEEYFGSIGIIKMDKKKGGKKIWLYKDKATGAPKGDGTVSYDDPFSAASAVEWFNGKEWKGA
jgi:RNA-binding protein FUS